MLGQNIGEAPDFWLLLASIFNVGCWTLVTEDFESVRPQEIKIRNFIDGELVEPLCSCYVEPSRLPSP